jgi:hypothetical protein
MHFMERKVMMPIEWSAATEHTAIRRDKPSTSAGGRNNRVTGPACWWNLTKKVCVCKK